MSSELIELSKYRMEKAKEDLANSIADTESGFIKGSINRSYYAVFHLVHAVPNYAYRLWDHNHVLQGAC